MRTLAEGVVRSTTLMVPCPWALHAMHFLADHPEIPFGVHLTVISDPADYRWGPLTAPGKGALPGGWRADISTTLTACLHFCRR